MVDIFLAVFSQRQQLEHSIGESWSISVLWWNLVKKTSNEKKNITPSPTKYEIGNVLGNTICLLTQVTCSTISLFSLLLTSSAEHLEIYKLHQILGNT